jgi:prevent-host-death family protein
MHLKNLMQSIIYEYNIPYVKLEKRRLWGGVLQSATCATILSMNRTITQRELRNQSASVLREVEAGRTIVVTRNGTPVAELRPVQPRRFVLRATLADAAARAPRIDAARFRADLDAVIDQRLDD